MLRYIKITILLYDLVDLIELLNVCFGYKTKRVHQPFLNSSVACVHLGGDAAYKSLHEQRQGDQNGRIIQTWWI